MGDGNNWGSENALKNNNWGATKNHWGLKQLGGCRKIGHTDIAKNNVRRLTGHELSTKSKVEVVIVVV